MCLCDRIRSSLDSNAVCLSEVCIIYNHYNILVAKSYNFDLIFYIIK